jgi:hypothetical protein
VKGTAGKRYALGSLAVASVAALAVFPLVAPLGRGALGWALLGWTLMAGVGVAGGAWMASLHGRQGTDFLKAMGTCILSRLAGAAVGAAVAGSQGMDAVWPYLAGLGAGFISLQLFEIGWFLRRTRGLTLTRGSDAVGH